MLSLHKLARPLLSHVILVCLLCGLACVGTSVRADETTRHPVLRIETGRHSQTIWKIDTDAAGRFLVTASADATVRVWELTSGKLLQTLRVPLNAKNIGSIPAVALSPDGSTIACTGWIDYGAPRKQTSIYLFDRASGSVTRRILDVGGAAGGEVFSLRFSQDGRRLAAGCDGVRVFDVATGNRLWADTGYGDGNGVDFDAAGRLVTGAVDGHLRLYAPDGRLIAKQLTPGKVGIWSVRFSPDGKHIAAGLWWGRRVLVFSSTDLTRFYRPDNTGINGDLKVVCWSPDGRYLYAGSQARDAKGRVIIRRWSNAGYPLSSQSNKGHPGYVDLSTGVRELLYDLHSLPGNQGVVFGAEDPAWGTFDGGVSPRQRLFVPAASTNFSGQENMFAVAEDGASVRFGLGPKGQEPLIFHTHERTLLPVTPGGEADALLPALRSIDGFHVVRRQGENENYFELNGKLLSPEHKYDWGRDWAFSPDRQSLVVGTYWHVRRFDLNGVEKWARRMPSQCNAVCVSNDNRLLIAGFADGTIRWFRMSDGKELLDFYPHSDQKRWVAWTPSGYYDCSPGGEDLIGWHINRSKEEALDFYPASRFRDQFYRPDVVQHILSEGDEPKALRLANAERVNSGAKPTAVVATVQEVLPPVVRIQSPADGDLVSGSTITLRYTVRAPQNAPAQSVRILMDGRPLSVARGLDFSSSAVASSPNSSGEQEYQTVLQAPGLACEITVVAANRNATSSAATVRLRYQGKAPTLSVRKPVLYVLAVGVGKYIASPGKDLTFPAKDARDFTRVIQKQQGRLYQQVVVKILTDAEATRDSVQDGLEWISRTSTAQDVAMVFLSGHGDNDPNGDYHFLPTNFDGEHWSRTAVSFALIKQALANIKGKALFFLDTCHSGAVLNGGLRSKAFGPPDVVGVVNDLTSAENGVIVFTSSTGRQLSYERDEWENGAFTKALVEGLSGKADGKKTGRVTVSMVDLYVSERVRELTNNKQSPTTTKPDTVADFPIAIGFTEP